LAESIASPLGIDRPVTNWIEAAATHWPPAHVIPAPVHALPQAPQLAASLDRSLQPDGHRACPAGQTATHAPCEHVMPGMHCAQGQGPVGSSVFQHVPLHERRLAPAVHVGVVPHAGCVAPDGTLHETCSE
jgi:hypothetical protein